MVFLYNIGIFFYSLLVRLAALFNAKAKFFVEGRKNVFSEIEQLINPANKHIWFHFASLGEFEQGRPVLEKIKSTNPEKKVIITFFSPSGYEIRKNYPLADGVFYLPLDTRDNASKFIRAINPEIAVFTKYEFWHHYFETLSDKKIPLFLISSIFRPDQIFFKFYGGFNRKILNHITWFFVQNQESVNLLAGLDLKNVSIAGDTRFDRVSESAEKPVDLPIIRKFCDNERVMIAGSTWPADETLIKVLSNVIQDWKIILVPHEIGIDHLNQIEEMFPLAIRYTALTDADSQGLRILIIDTIGMLSALYQYADIAYIGGGFGVGIHNTLEAAAFGVPVIFGPNYRKFAEAKDLISIGAAISVDNGDALAQAFGKFKDNREAGEQAKAYVIRQKGATEFIYERIRKYLD